MTHGGNCYDVGDYSEFMILQDQKKVAFFFEKAILISNLDL